MYRLLDLHNCQNDIKISPEQPSAVLDTADFAISAITADGSLIYCNRTFLQEHIFDHKYGFHASVRESLPDLWKRFREPDECDDNTFKVINLRTNGYDKPLGHLLVSLKEDVPKVTEQDLHSLVSVDEHPDFIDSYAGLYVATPQADTVKVNPSYEKIAFLSGNDVVGRNLAELVEKGFFSKSVTLSILKGLRKRGSSQQTLFQTLLCGKDVLVTGKPIFSEHNKLDYVLTYVHDLVVMDTIARKCIEHGKRIRSSGVDPGLFQNSGNKSGRKTPDCELVEFPELPIVARDPLTITTLKQVVRAAEYMAPILLTGETGVGKDLMAKYIHLLQTTRQTMPFIAVNCSAIPGDLLESELFGYEEGAFSGASKGGRTGLFAAADGGILFLNEISEIPLSLQAKLLTALDEGCIRPLGSSKIRMVKTRIICATNRDLQSCIQEGTFRNDLYYRIKVLTVKISPLRKRKNDILPLVHHFMSRLSSEHGLTRFLSPAAQEILLGYHWPGNVRELRNVIEQLIIFSSTNQVSVGDLPEELLGCTPESFQEYAPRLVDGVTLKMAVQRFEKELIEEVLEKCGKTSEAARVLGIDPTTLTRKLKKTPDSAKMQKALQNCR
jgi:transcriptional regulator with PAS, ATPase and Fis domain